MLCRYDDLQGRKTPNIFTEIKGICGRGGVKGRSYQRARTLDDTPVSIGYICIYIVYI